MGVHKHGGTMDGALTPICNMCGVSLCWDISEQEYSDNATFWNEWICRDCNGGEPFTKSFYAVARNGDVQDN